MSNADLAQSIRSELAASGIPFDLIQVSDTEIRITQIGLHEALPAICQILDSAGLWSFDDDSSTEDARVEIEDTPKRQVTINILKRKGA